MLSRQVMIRRLRRTATVEALNIGILAAAFFVVAGVPATTANLIGYGLVALLLLEGSGYWWLKHRQLQSGARCPSAMATFRVLRAANIALLLIAVPVILVELWHRPGAQSWPGLAFTAFAAAEHVNYPHPAVPPEPGRPAPAGPHPAAAEGTPGGGPAAVPLSRRLLRRRRAVVGTRAHHLGHVGHRVVQ